MFTRLALILMLLTGIWPIAAKADSGVLIALTGIAPRTSFDDVSNYSNPNTFPGCDVQVQYVNDTDDHIEKISGNLGDYSFEIKELIAHGAENDSFTMGEHSCRYVLFQFQQLQANPQSLQLDRCAMEGVREGDCMGRITVRVDPSITPQLALVADSQTHAALEKFLRCNASSQDSDVVQKCFESHAPPPAPENPPAVQPDPGPPPQNTDANNQSGGLQRDQAHPEFNVYEQNGFRLEIPNDLANMDQSGSAAIFHGGQSNRFLRFESGGAAAAPGDWLAAQYQQDTQYALAHHFATSPDDPGAYIFPAQASAHVWSQTGDFYVVSWNDSGGVNHYRTVVAIQGPSGTKWADFDFVTPQSPQIGCARTLAYMLDTILVSASVRQSARDPHCS